MITSRSWDDTQLSYAVRLTWGYCGKKYYENVRLLLFLSHFFKATFWLFVNFGSFSSSFSHSVAALSLSPLALALALVLFDANVCWLGSLYRVLLFSSWCVIHWKYETSVFMLFHASKYKRKYENNPHVTIYQFHVEIVTGRKKKEITKHTNAHWMMKAHETR